MHVTLIALSGSLRSASYNTALLTAAQLLAPPGVAIEFYQDVGRLPHFNADLDDNLPAPAADFRDRIARADGVLIACPEYARGIPGAFKNCLDWLVGSEHFPDKPVAIFNASPRSAYAQEALRLVLSTMSARIVDEACITIPLLGTGLDAVGISTHKEFSTKIRVALEAFVHSLPSPPSRPRIARAIAQ